MDGENKEEGTSRGLKVALGVLVVVALALGVGILVVGLNFGNSGNGVKDENLITEYETVNEDGEEVHVQVRSYKPEKTESKPSGTGQGTNNESDLTDGAEASQDNDIKVDVDESGEGGEE